MGLWKWQCCLIVVSWKWQCFPIVGLSKWQWVQIGGWKTGNVSWLGGRKTGNVLIGGLKSWQSGPIASFPVPQSGHCQLSGSSIRTLPAFRPLNQDSLPLTQAHNWETLPVSWNHNQATLPLSQSHLVWSLKLFPSFLCEEGLNEKFKYHSKTSEISSTIYQKISDQWRVPLI